MKDGQRKRREGALKGRNKVPKLLMGQSKVTESPDFTLSTNSWSGDTLNEGPEDGGPCPLTPPSSAGDEEVAKREENDERRTPMTSEREETALEARSAILVFYPLPIECKTTMFLIL